ncbi:ATP-binding protein [Streptomyces sp. KR80]|uniref:ATP-binding protein n=1 Tax=Streptomyces sp. KR80 TaxID=3457426 RepID=UPI003FD5DFAA
MCDTSDQAERLISAATALPGHHGRRYSVSVRGCEAVVPAVRHAVRDALANWGLPPGCDALAAMELVASELITNAVRHAGGLTAPITVSIEVHPDGALGFGIGDEHPGAPEAQYAPRDAEGGRGMAIADHLVAELGGAITIEWHGTGGKTVWVEVPADVPPPRLPWTGGWAAVRWEDLAPSVAGSAA